MLSWSINFYKICPSIAISLHILFRNSFPILCLLFLIFDFQFIDFFENAEGRSANMLWATADNISLCWIVKEGKRTLKKRQGRRLPSTLPPANYYFLVFSLLSFRILCLETIRKNSLAYLYFSFNFIFFYP